MRIGNFERVFAGVLSAFLGAAPPALAAEPTLPAWERTQLLNDMSGAVNAYGDVTHFSGTNGRGLVCTRNAPGGLFANLQYATSQTNEHYACYSPTGAKDVSVCFGGWLMNPSEVMIPPSVWTAAGVTVNAGGTGYGAGDLLTFPINTALGDFAQATVRVDAVSTAGAVTSAHVESPGVYRSLLTSASTPTLFSGVTIYNNATNAAGTGFQTLPNQIVVAGWGVTGTNVPASTTVSSWNSSTGVGVLSQATTGSGLTTTTALKFTSTGSGATFNWSWNPYAYQVRVGLEPAYSSAGVAVAAPAANAVRQLTVNSYKPYVPGAGHPDFDWQYVSPASDIMVPMGGTVCTDPVAVNVPAGGTIGLRIFVNGLNTALGAGLAPDEYLARATSLPLTELSSTGTMAANGPTAGGTPMVRPLAVIGTPAVYKPTVAIVGDSIAFCYSGSVYDNFDGARDCGVVERAVAQTAPWINLAASSKTFGAMFSTGWGRNKTLETIGKFGITNVFSEMGTNDFNNSVAASTVLAQEAQLAADYRLRGVQTVGTMTLFPRTNSSNVSGVACPGIVQRNAWLRIGLKTDGSGNYVPASALPSWTSASGNVTAGSGTVTMTTMSQSGNGGSTFPIVAGAVVNILDGAPETVTVSSVSGLTWTATFANAHNSPFNFTVQSPYFGVYDYVADISPTFESAIGACTWANYATMTLDGTHPAPGTAGAAGGPGHGLAASILAPIIAANIK